MRHDDFPPSRHPLVNYRPLERSDAAAWYAYLARPEVVEHTSWNLANADGLQPLFDAYESTDPDSQIRFAVIANADGRLAGTFGFHTISCRRSCWRRICVPRRPSSRVDFNAKAICDPTAK